MGNTPQFFTKITTDAHHELFVWANKKPLRWAILMTIASRVASKDQITTGLSKGEFFLSETEYKKFGLEKSKQGNIRRIVNELITFRIVQKVENRNGSNNCNVYRFIDSNFIDCSREQKTKNREPIENQQRTDREPIETNKECKNEKNEKNEKIVGDKSPHPMEVFYKMKIEQSEKYQKFAEEIADKNKITKDIVLNEFEKFFNYWKAKNPNGKKEFWEMQRVFDLKSRLNTWFGKVKSYHVTHTVNPIAHFPSA